MSSLFLSNPPILSSGVGFNPIVISGSARNNGNTTQAIQSMLGDVPTIFLCDIHINHYDYKKRNDDDDFLPLIQKLVLYDPLVFATPVYWYSMGSRMKVFWDRMTDIFYRHKDLSVALQGKTTAMIVASGGGKPEGFETSLEKTFAYLKMNYVGCWDHIFPMEKNRDHNAAQQKLAQAHWIAWMEKMALSTPESQKRE